MSTPAQCVDCKALIPLGEWYKVSWEGEVLCQNDFNQRQLNKKRETASPFENVRAHNLAEQTRVTTAVNRARLSTYPGIVQLSDRRYAVLQYSSGGLFGPNKVASASYVLATKPLPYAEARAELYRLRGPENLGKLAADNN